MEYAIKSIVKIKWIRTLTSSRIRRLSKESFWIVAGQFASILGSIVLVRILTGHLGPVQYGQLALGLTVAALVNQVVMGGAVSGIGRYYSIAVEKQDISGYLHTIKQLMFYGTLAALLIGLILLSGLFFLGYSKWIGLSAVVLLYSILSGYNSSLSGIQNAARHRAIVAFHTGLNAWLKVLFAISMMRWLGQSGVAVVLGYILSLIMVSASQLGFLYKYISDRTTTRQRKKNQWMQQMWKYSWPMAASGLFNWGYYASQRWALQLFSTTAEVGQFYALTQVAYTPIIMAGQMFLSFLVPILFVRAGDATNYIRLRSTHRVVVCVSAIGLGVTLIVAVVCYFTHNLIFRLITSSSYHSVSLYMPYVVFSAGTLQVSQTIGSLILVRKRTKDVLPLAVWGQLYISAQNFLFAYLMGIYGLILSMVIGALLHLAWMCFIVFRQNIIK